MFDLQLSRIVMPFTVEEYQIGQLWSVIESSSRETGGGDGVEILVNEPFSEAQFPDSIGEEFSTGQYTKKRYYLKSKLNGFVRTLLPNSAMILEEIAWNAYPYCKTVITNEYMKQDFEVSIESFHLPGKGELQNVHRLTPDQLAQREVIMVDIAGELLENNDYVKEEDPTKFSSTKTGRGPLTPGWANRADPVMTCYKLVKCNFHWFGFQNRVERYIQRLQQRVFTKFHRQVFCWMDNWIGMTIGEIRELEIAVKAQLEQQRAEAQLRGCSTRD